MNVVVHILAINCLPNHNKIAKQMNDGKCSWEGFVQEEETLSHALCLLFRTSKSIA